MTVVSLLRPVPGRAITVTSQGLPTGASPHKDAAATGRALARLTGRLGSAAGTVLVVMAIAAFVLLALGPRLLGYQTSTMLTGSMAPLIKPGDVVVSLPVAVNDLAVGDIITYHIPVEDQRVETHRIVGLTTNADGSTAVQTKGDANNGVDPWTATLQGSTVSRQVATIPHLGTIIRTLRQPVVLKTLLYGAPAVLVVGLLVTIWHKEPVPIAADRQAPLRAPGA